MNVELLRALLEKIATGEVAIAEAIERIRNLPFTDVEGARLDHHREIRTGTPEVIFGEGKTAEQIVTIAREMIDRSGAVLVTRIDASKASRLLDAIAQIDYHADARIAMRRRSIDADRTRSSDISAVPVTTDLATAAHHVAVVSAGTSDQPVAEEAARTLEFLHIGVRRYRDVGISGLHRLLAERMNLRDATAVIVVAGMEGALPSVVGGLVDASADWPRCSR
jgi:pyridinium-3,5-biscarboxylic acid mononucleotide synthase